MYDIYISTSYHCIWEFIRILRKISRRTSINHLVTVKTFGEKRSPWWICNCCLQWFEHVPLQKHAWAEMWIWHKMDHCLDTPKLLYFYDSALYFKYFQPFLIVQKLWFKHLKVITVIKCKLNCTHLVIFLYIFTAPNIFLFVCLVAFCLFVWKAETIP